MMEVSPQSTTPGIVASQQEPPPQTRGQEHLSTDFTGAAHLANQGSVDATTGDLSAYGDSNYTPPYSYDPTSAQTRGFKDGGTTFSRDASRRPYEPQHRDEPEQPDGPTYRPPYYPVEPLERRGRWPAPPPWGLLSDSPQAYRNVGAGAPNVVGDERLWEEEFSGGGHMVWGSPRVQSPQVTLDVSANVPVRVQLMTGESAVVRQRSNRQIPAGYAQSVGIKPKKVIG